jgi:hypothetical protein
LEKPVFSFHQGWMAETPGEEDGVAVMDESLWQGAAKSKAMWFLTS